MPTTINQEAEQVVKNRTRRLQEAALAELNVKQLAAAIADYSIDACYVSYSLASKTTMITAYFYETDRVARARELVAVLIEAGATVEQEQLHNATFYSKPSETSVLCKLGDFEITVKGLPLPPTCEIEEIPTTGKMYKVVCTGKGGAG